MRWSFLAKGGNIANTVCDFSDAKFNPSEIPSQVIPDGAEGLLIAPSVNKMNQAVDLAKATKKRLRLFGSHTVYTGQILQQGTGAVEGLVEPFRGILMRLAIIRLTMMQFNYGAVE